MDMGGWVGKGHAMQKEMQRLRDLKRLACWESQGVECGQDWQEVSLEAQQGAGCEGFVYSSRRHSRVPSWAWQAKRFAFLRDNWSSHEEGGLEGDPTSWVAVTMVQSKGLVWGALEKGRVDLVGTWGGAHGLKEAVTVLHKRPP